MNYLLTMTGRLILILCLFQIISCKNKNYYTSYKTIRFNELPKNIQPTINSLVGDFEFDDKYKNICYDLTKKCDDCNTHNDDEGMLGLLINRRPHIVINNCGNVYEVPVTFQGEFYLLDDNHIYFPKNIPWRGSVDERFPAKKYVDIKTLKYGVVELK